MSDKNIFDINDKKVDKGQEIKETLFESSTVIIEKIISNNYSSPPGFWYDQKEDEWVTILQGEAEMEFETGEIKKLISGDHLLIPAGKKHRIKSTSGNPNVVWLAVFIKKT